MKETLTDRVVDDVLRIVGGNLKGEVVQKLKDVVSTGNEGEINAYCQSIRHSYELSNLAVTLIHALKQDGHLE